MNATRWLRGALAVAAVLGAACSDGGESGELRPTAVTDQADTTVPGSRATDTSVVATNGGEAGGLTLLALGDSIPYNSSDDCRGCRGYVEQYGEALAIATGEQVHVINRSRHDGLTAPGLLQGLSDDDLRQAIATADAITISIGFNDSPMLVADDPCDGPAGEADLARYTDDCIAKWSTAFAEQFAGILDEITAIRAGMPTLLTVINIFDQWLGFGGNTAAFDDHISAVTKVLEAQNAKICEITTAHGALCADLHTAFNGPDHDQPSGDLLGPDYAHPSQAGNDLIATTLAGLGFAPLARP